MAPTPTRRGVPETKLVWIRVCSRAKVVEEGRAGRGELVEGKEHVIHDRRPCDVLRREGEIVRIGLVSGVIAPGVLRRAYVVEKGLARGGLQGAF